jgi:partner of Y14 and mago protein
MSKRKKNKNKEKQAATSAPPAAVATTAKPPPPPPAATDPAKKLRNLRKKLRDIEALEKKLSSGEIESPEPEQLEKVSRRVDVEKDIVELERNGVV